MDPNRRFHSPNDFLGKSAEDRIAEEKASQKRVADLFPVADVRIGDGGTTVIKPTGS